MILHQFLIYLKNHILYIKVIDGSIGRITIVENDINILDIHCEYCKFKITKELINNKIIKYSILYLINKESSLIHILNSYKMQKLF